MFGFWGTRMRRVEKALLWISKIGVPQNRDVEHSNYGIAIATPQTQIEFDKNYPRTEAFLGHLGELERVANAVPTAELRPDKVQ